MLFDTHAHYDDAAFDPDRELPLESQMCIRDRYACGGAPRLCTKRALFRCEAVLPK